MQTNFLSNKQFTYATKGIMGAVVGTTILKAISRPAFNLMDKKTDVNARKYSATNEFLYQLLCLGLTFVLVIPMQRGGFKLAQKHLQGSKVLEKVKNFKDFGILSKDTSDFTKEAQTLLKTKETKLSDEDKLKFNKVKGAVELASFIGSILGLTIIAPPLSHKILHPVMKALGFKNDKAKEGKPVEPFLADAKVPTEKETKSKLDKNV